MTRRTNDEWLTALNHGPGYDDALSDLRAILLRGLRFALANRISSDLDQAVEDFVQDALLKILDKLDTFRGEAMFTTWAQKVAVRVALSELRRQRWKDVSLEGLIRQEDGSDFVPIQLSDPGPNPERQTSQKVMLAIVSRLIDEELTERQRQAMLSVLVYGMPLDEVARRMDTNRNALYKLLHDARLRLKNRLAREDLTPEEVLAVF